MDPDPMRRQIRRGVDKAAVPRLIIGGQCRLGGTRQDRHQLEDSSSGGEEPVRAELARPSPEVVRPFAAQERPRLVPFRTSAASLAPVWREQGVPKRSAGSP